MFIKDQEIKLNFLKYVRVQVLEVLTGNHKNFSMSTTDLTGF